VAFPSASITTSANSLRGDPAPAVTIDVDRDTTPSKWRNVAGAFARLFGGGDRRNLDKRHPLRTSAAR
jgi:hypothetical protein